MSLTYQRSRITGAGLVAAQYDLTLERQTIMDNILFIPGIANPVSEINQLLFGQGQQGTFIAPSLTPSLISGSTFGTGVETLPDLSPRNNPFSQATPSSRGAWFREPKRGRVNVITPSEDYQNIVWAKTAAGAGSVPTYQGVGSASPVSATSQIWRFQAGGTDSTDRSFIIQTVVVTGDYRGSIFVRNLQAFPVTIWANVTTSETHVLPPGEWVRVTFTRPAIASSGFRFGAIGSSSGAAAFDLEVSGSQCETDTGAPTNYQRVTTAFDVTEAGQRDCFGVRFDGTDDWYERAIDFSGTDKVTVFVAMRRRSDAARGTVLELTSSIDSNNGAFHLTAPNAASATFGFESKGTTLRDAVITQAMGNPRIITAIGDISGDLASIQVDNGTPTTNTGDQGSGNYANSTLYLGRRGGSSLSLNGDIFAVIAAGDDYTSATRQRVRTILSRITPTVNL